MREGWREATWLACAAWLACAPAGAGEWPQWRGPFLNGSAEERGLPADLEAPGVARWRVTLPGDGSSTPVVWGDRLFLSSLDAETFELLAMCLDARTGRERWRRPVGVGFDTNNRNNLASPSPATDGSTVVFAYGSGHLAAFDLEGKPRWSRNVAEEHGAFNVMWTYSSSPLLRGGRLYVQVLHRDRSYQDESAPPAGSYLLGVDVESGRDVFKRSRETSARGESQESYATPVPFEFGGTESIVVVDGNDVSAHDPADGRERWRCGGFNPENRRNFRVIPSVVSAGGLVVACGARGRTVIAVRGGGSGDVSATHVAWRLDGKGSDVSTPLAYRNHLYLLDEKRRLLKLDPATGGTEGEVSLDAGEVFRASPTGADGKIFCVNKRGRLWVVDSERLTILSSTDVPGGDNCRSTVVAAGGALYVRNGAELHSFRR